MKSLFENNVSLSALIVEGGAMRSVFSSGLLDGFLVKRFNPFDTYFGVSAGSNNLAAYLAGDVGKSLEIYTEFAVQKEFINYSRFLSGGHLIDLDWLSEKIFSSGHIKPEEVLRFNKPFFVVLTDVKSGGAKYISANINNLPDIIKASASLPLLYRYFPVVSGSPMTDGGVADGIPVQEAINKGVKNIMLIRSRSKDYLKKDTAYHQFIRWKLRNYSNLTQTMRQRVKLFEDSMNIVRNPPRGVKILEVCPPIDFSMGRFNNNKHDLEGGYRVGFELASKVIELWSDLVD